MLKNVVLILAGATLVMCAMPFVLVDIITPDP